MSQLIEVDILKCINSANHVLPLLAQILLCRLKMVSETSVLECNLNLIVASQIWCYSLLLLNIQNLFRSWKKLRLLMYSYFFPPDRSMKISNFSKTFHTIFFVKFSTVIIRPNVLLPAQWHPSRSTGI